MRQYRAGNRRRARLMCYMAPQCQTKSVLQEELLAALAAAMKSAVPEITEKISAGLSAGQEARRAQLAALEARLKGLQSQEEYQYELLERREYSPEVFARRHARLTKEMDAARAAFETAQKDLATALNAPDVLIRLSDALSALKNPSIAAVEKNNLLKALIDRIEYAREKGENQNSFELQVFLRL